MNRLKLGLEAIDFQKDHPLPIELERIVQGMYDNVYTTTAGESQIIEAIKRHCGIAIKEIHWRNDYTFAITTPLINHNHPLLSESVRERITQAKKGKAAPTTLSLVNGVVDRKAAKISGDYAKVEFTLKLRRPRLRQGIPISVREYVAFMLHELGHAFSYFELMGSNFVTNFILSDAAARLAGVQSDVDKHKILGELEANGHIEIDDTECLVNSATAEEVYVLLMNDHFRKLRNVLGEDIYSARGWEALADQFVGRMGYGKELAIAMDRLYSNVTPGYTNKGQIVSLIVSILNLIRSVLGYLIRAGLIALLSPALAVGWLAGMFVYNVAIYLTISPLESTYDKPLRRIEVIRNEMVKRLKEADLSRDERKLLVEEIDVVSKIIKTRNEPSFSVAQKLAILLRPKFNKQSSSIKLQQQLEDLLASQLFVDAERLEQLA